jgi:AcrR family transcriptional regulator
MPVPARRTGRPRSTAADRAILQATRAALVELGWSKLAMSDVAARAKVAKTTLYRRWPGKNELVVDAVAALLDEQLALPDSGTLAGDIEGMVRRFAELLELPETKTALMAVVAESTRDEALRARIRSAIVDRQKELVLRGRARAQARGELPAEPDAAASAYQADLIFDVIAGTVVHRSLVSNEPVDAAWAGQFTRLLLGGLAAMTPAGGDGPGTGGTGTGGADSP